MTERLYCEDCAFFKQEEKEMGYCYAECGKDTLYGRVDPLAASLKHLRRWPLKRKS